MEINNGFNIVAQNFLLKKIATKISALGFNVKNKEKLERDGVSYLTPANWNENNDFIVKDTDFHPTNFNSIFIYTNDEAEKFVTACVLQSLEKDKNTIK